MTLSEADEAEANEIFDLYDTNGNGNIDYQEFLSMITKQFEKPTKFYG